LFVGKCVTLPGYIDGTKVTERKLTSELVERLNNNKREAIIVSTS